jgi:hypothetical protein
MQVFTDYSSFQKFVLEETECKLFSSQGINYRSEKRTCILRSVDDTPFYADNLEDTENPQYTLYGQVGDQDEKDMNNRNLLNPVRTEKIFLFRRTKSEWIWFGRYNIKSKMEKIHPDKNGNDRKIIVLQLERYKNIGNTIPFGKSKKTIQLSLSEQKYITPSRKR